MLKRVEDPVEYIKQAIPDVVLIKPVIWGDDRGFFLETFRQNEFVEHCGDFNFVQHNHSKSTQGILRGLHYQISQPQGKLVRVVQGEVFDVAVDMRRSSPTFGQWVEATLSSANQYQFWVPPGFAHAFYVVSETAEFVYNCTDYYAPEYERSLRWDCAELNIQWPLVNGKAPTLSDKDAQAKGFSECDTYA